MNTIAWLSSLKRNLKKKKNWGRCLCMFPIRETPLDVRGLSNWEVQTLLEGGLFSKVCSSDSGAAVGAEQAWVTQEANRLTHQKGVGVLSSPRVGFTILPESSQIHVTRPLACLINYNFPICCWQWMSVALLHVTIGTYQKCLRLSPSLIILLKWLSTRLHREYAPSLFFTVRSHNVLWTSQEPP